MRFSALLLGSFGSRLYLRWHYGRCRSSLERRATITKRLDFCNDLIFTFDQLRNGGTEPCKECGHF